MTLYFPPFLSLFIAFISANRVLEEYPFHFLEVMAIVDYLSFTSTVEFLIHNKFRDNVMGKPPVDFLKLKSFQGQACLNGFPSMY